MKVETNDKFGVFFLSQCGVGEDVPQEEEIEAGLWVSQRLGLELAEHWSEWLGSLTVEELGKKGVGIYATVPSEHPEDNNAENLALQQRVNDILNALLLQGVPTVGRGIVGHGANVNGDLRLRSYAPLGRHLLTAELPPFIVGMREIDRAIACAKRIRQMLDRYEATGRRDWSRLIRGIRTLLVANRVDNTVGDRLHQFVRTIEAVLMPRTGTSRNDFAHRGQTLTVANAQTRAILLELYDLRSSVEHLNVPHDALQTGTEAQRIALVARRTRQADMLARYAILRVLESDAVLKAFQTDDDIENFWRLPDHVKLQWWGQRLDIEAVQ